MNLFLSALAAAGLCAAGYIGLPLPDPQAASAQSTAASGEAYRLRNSVQEGSCAISHGKTKAGGLAELTLAPECEALLAGVSRARYWQENADGTVAFTADGIDPIVTFSVSDGAAYETFAPDQPAISLETP